MTRTVLWYMLPIVTSGRYLKVWRCVPTERPEIIHMSLTFWAECRLILDISIPWDAILWSIWLFWGGEVNSYTHIPKSQTVSLSEKSFLSCDTVHTVSFNVAFLLPFRAGPYISTYNALVSFDEFLGPYKVQNGENYALLKSSRKTLISNPSWRQVVSNCGNCSLSAHDVETCHDRKPLFCNWNYLLRYTKKVTDPWGSWLQQWCPHPWNFVLLIIRHWQCSVV